MFYMYWIFMVISLITSFAYIYHAYKENNRILFITSCIQSILTVILLFTNLIYISNMELLERFENEFVFLWRQFTEGNESAFMILVAYGIMICLVLWNGRWLTFRVKEHTITF